MANMICSLIITLILLVLKFYSLMIIQSKNKYHIHTLSSSITAFFQNLISHPKAKMNQGGLM